MNEWTDDIKKMGGKEKVRGVWKNAAYFLTS